MAKDCNSKTYDCLLLQNIDWMVNAPFMKKIKCLKTIWNLERIEKQKPGIKVEPEVELPFEIFDIREQLILHSCIT